MDVLAITVIFTALAAVFVALRLYTRLFIVKTPGWDDVLISCALVVDCALTAFILVERHYGLGVPKEELPLHVVERQLFYLWLSIPFYNLTLVFAKLSALTLYARLFRRRSFLITTYILMGCLVIAGLWMTMSGFVYCIPIRDFWNPDAEIRSAHCLSDGAVWFTNAGIQLATDLLILALPMPLLWHLRMPNRQKCGAFLVFSIGIFIIATSAARMYELSKIVRFQDFTKANAAAALWSSIEANVSIICICLAPLHPLISRIFSFCFLPQPLHSNASKEQSHTTQLTELHNTDGMIWYSELFSPGPAYYSASISKVNTNEAEHRNEEGIRVVRELRMQSDSVCHTPILRPYSANEHGLGAEKGEGASKSSAGHENAPSKPSIEWDLADFEFPDYKQTMNAPI
ncbi:hypothetical protein N7457_005699 [Penicillium paradoxum]|uniref:uncharacterized protein n=1 Tax=Penicillium paradoxum TaxID=176176 RepID=UPI0025484A36|nr:uncharacterized protein N7457_005699 [Penicillium paradoxum]KAJ5780539.1 hypothetical protein N7457_005699 [Penicillium paradoxum]